MVLLRVNGTLRVGKAEPRRVLMESGGHIVPSVRRMTALQSSIPKTANSSLVDCVFNASAGNVDVTGYELSSVEWWRNVR